MDYKKHYYMLMERAKNRILEGYCEKHHIIPRCMGGEHSEIVDLTPEEHYVAHQLLVKIYPSESKLLYAAKMMTIGSADNIGRGNRLYGWLRRRFADIISNDKNRNHKISINNARYWKGKSLSEETKLKISAALMGRPGPNKGRKFSNESKLKMSIAAKGRIPWNKGKIGVQVSCNKGKTLSSQLKEKIRITCSEKSKYRTRDKSGKFV